MPPSCRPPIVLAVGAITVRFERVGDRWHHTVTARGVTWRSLEGPSDDDEASRWPASPAFIEVTRLGGAGDAPVMAVGQAGRTHFSAVILPDAGDPGAIRFDLAARITETPRGLGSTYVATPDAGAAGEDGGGTLRVVPTDAGGGLPRTVRWSYRFGAEGLAILDGAGLLGGAGGDPRQAPAPA